MHSIDDRYKKPGPCAQCEAQSHTPLIIIRAPRPGLNGNKYLDGTYVYGERAYTIRGRYHMLMTPGECDKFQVINPYCNRAYVCCIYHHTACKRSHARPSRPRRPAAHAGSGGHDHDLPPSGGRRCAHELWRHDGLVVHARSRCTRGYVMRYIT